MSWLSRVFDRLRGREVAKSEAVERADRVMESVKEIRIVVIPKRDQDLRDGFSRAGQRLAGR